MTLYLNFSKQSIIEIWLEQKSESKKFNTENFIISQCAYTYIRSDGPERDQTTSNVIRFLFKCCYVLIGALKYSDITLFDSVLPKQSWKRKKNRHFLTFYGPSAIR